MLAERVRVLPSATVRVAGSQAYPPDIVRFEFTASDVKSTISLARVRVEVALQVIVVGLKL
jgi:hypothetical protein